MLWCSLYLDPLTIISSIIFHAMGKIVSAYNQFYINKIKSTACKSAVTSAGTDAVDTIKMANFVNGSHQVDFEMWFNVLRQVYHRRSNGLRVKTVQTSCVSNNQRQWLAGWLAGWPRLRPLPPKRANFLHYLTNYLFLITQKASLTTINVYNNNKWKCMLLIIMWKLGQQSLFIQSRRGGRART